MYKRENFLGSDRQKVVESVPQEDITTYYDHSDIVQWGHSTTRGKVEYHFIEGDKVEDGHPIYLSTSVLYDGIGNEDLPEDAKMISYHEANEKLNEYRSKEV